MRIIKDKSLHLMYFIMKWLFQYENIFYIFHHEELQTDTSFH